MKKFNKYFIVSFCILTTSCNNYLDVNSNPDEPETVSLDVILTPTEVNLAYAVGGDISITTGIFTQQIGYDVTQNYTTIPASYSGMWGFFYDGILNDLIQIEKLATDRNAKYYLGISKVLQAYALGTVTDLWGEVPFTEAFKGIDIIKPAYDKQEDIYKTINNLLIEGIALLNIPSSSAGLKPGRDDVLYDGNIPKWIKFANTLKLRYAIHLTKKNAIAAADTVIAGLAAPGGVISGNDEDAQVIFTNDLINANPLYQLNTISQGAVNYKSTATSFMESLNDPRLSVYVNKVDTNYYELGSFPGSSNSPVILMSFAEAKFIEAEAYARLGDHTAAKAAYDVAITASMAKSGVNMGTYLDQPEVNYVLAPDKIGTIMQQKYIALFLQAETYTDMRRTDFKYPPLTPNMGNEIPRRFLIPQTELSYNGSNVPADGKNQFAKVWWDK